MKKLIFPIGLTVLILSSLSAYDLHLPWCDGPEDHKNNPECHAYAMARAFGHGEDSSEICPAITAPGNAILTQYFDKVVENLNGITDFSQLKKNDILSSSDHSVFVLTPGSNENDIEVRHIENLGKAPVTETLDKVFDGQWNPTIIWRRKDKWKMKVKNSFGGGEIKVGGNIYTSGETIYNLEWDANYSINAIENDSIHNGYKQIFYRWKWEDSEGYISHEKNYDLEIKWNINTTPTLLAKFHKEYKIYFHNQFEGVQLNGKMQVNGNIYNNIEDHNPFKVEEEDSILFKALAQEYNGIKYSFDHWNDQISSSTRSVHPEDHDSYTAYFKGKPKQVENVYFDCDIGEPIKLVWNEHQNQDVNYRIYRSEKDQNGNIIESHLIATVQHGTTSYTDRDFLMSANYDFLLRYDVRAHYTIENTEADVNWHAIFGKIGFDKRNIKNLTSISLLPKDFEISNYPNPFNSFTCIKYALPKASVVNISIYNIKGQLVRALYQGYRKAGYYTQTWNGTNQSGSLMPAGIYLVTMECKDKTYRNKLILLK